MQRTPWYVHFFETIWVHLPFHSIPVSQSKVELKLLMMLKYLNITRIQIITHTGHLSFILASTITCIVCCCQHCYSFGAFSFAIFTHEYTLSVWFPRHEYSCLLDKFQLHPKHDPFTFASTSTHRKKATSLLPTEFIVLVFFILLFFSFFSITFIRFRLFSAGQCAFAYCCHFLL